MKVQQPRRAVRDALTLPGDKSVTHRALLFAAAAPGQSTLTGALRGGDADASIAFARAMGARVEVEGDRIVVTGAPNATGPVEVDCGRSGTTLRLGAGLLCGLGRAAHLRADPQLLARPMARITAPLHEMGAKISWRDDGMHIEARRAPLRSITHAPAVASAQVKSAVLLAGVFSGIAVRVVEKVATRDHTERLLRAMGAQVQRVGDVLDCLPPKAWRPVDVAVPGDMSSAATLATAAALLPDAQVTLRNAGDNPTRTAFWSLLERMGVPLSRQRMGAADAAEPMAAVRVQGGATLRPLVLAPSEVAGVIDEVMLLGLLATRAAGTSTLRGLGELRVKESDRLAAMVRVLRAFGAQIEVSGDDVAITGPQALRAASGVDTARDHRVVMLAALSALRAEAPSDIVGAPYVADSFPGFFAALTRWGGIAADRSDG